MLYGSCEFGVEDTAEYFTLWGRYKKSDDTIASLWPGDYSGISKSSRKWIWRVLALSRRKDALLY